MQAGVIQRLALLATCAVAFASPAQAAPWAEPGDRQLREDVEALVDAGMIRGPATQWPLPWAQIMALAEDWQFDRLPPHLAARARRIQRYAEAASQQTLISFEASATTAREQIRTFDDHAREDSDAQLRVQHDFGSSYISYGVGYRRGQSGHDYHFDDVYGVHSFSNWALYSGGVPSWWGPGQESALLLSNSARPFVRVGIRRQTPYAFRWPVLRWLGPWTFETFAGRLDTGRTDFQHPLLLAFRVSFKPTQQLEIGLARVNQLCGSNRPCSPRIIYRAFIPGGGDNTGTLNEPGNQLASLDVRWGGMIGDLSGAMYTQVLAEDGGGPLIIPDVYSYNAGGTLSGGYGRGGTWHVGAEWTDTFGIRYFGTNSPNGRQRGTTYLSFIYTDGYSFHDRPIGASFDGDSQLYSVTGSMTDAKNRRLSLALRRARINVTSTPAYHVSRNFEQFWIGEAGINLPTAWGDIRSELRYQSDRPNTPGRRDGQVQFELGWKTQF